MRTDLMTVREKLGLRFILFYFGKLLGSSVGSAENVFVIPAALQNNFVVGVPFNTPHKSLCSFYTFSDFTLFGRNLGFLCFIRKITGEPAPFFAVVFVIPDSEKLPTAK